jgi:hypothetical protein
MNNEALIAKEQAQTLARYMRWPQWVSLQSLMAGGEEAGFFQEVAGRLARCIAKPLEAMRESVRKRLGSF